MEPIEWSKFHDWSLGPMTIDWQAGTISLAVGAQQLVKINVIDFSQITISRQLPWGMSFSINTIQCTQSHPSAWTLSIELQSGDTIRIEAARIEAVRD